MCKRRSAIQIPLDKYKGSVVTSQIDLEMLANLGTERRRVSEPKALVPEEHGLPTTEPLVVLSLDRLEYRSTLF